MDEEPWNDYGEPRGVVVGSKRREVARRIEEITVIDPGVPDRLAENPLVVHEEDHEREEEQSEGPNHSSDSLVA
jgi:hypothetical protein